MVKVLIGNMFESPAKTLVNTVNTVGVMGKGIAHEFKKLYSGMFADYKQKCAIGDVEPGVPYYYEDMLGTSIVIFPTKKHWKSPSRLQDVVNGLDIFLKKHKQWGITSVAFPPLGCGNGGLEWSDVGPIMYQLLSKLDIMVEIYAPYGTSRQQLTKEFLGKPVNIDGSIKGKLNNMLNPNWIILLEVLNQLSKQEYANPVGRTIFQKIAYILTEQGINTGFTFKARYYGPFSKEIKNVLSIFANMNLIKEKQLGNMQALELGPEYQNIYDNYKNNITQHQKKIDKTVDLFSRIKNTEQAEEMTTVLYAARQIKKGKESNNVSEKELYDYILDWKKNWKNKEKKESIASTIRDLEMLDWLKLKYSESLPVS